MRNISEFIAESMASVFESSVPDFETTTEGASEYIKDYDKSKYSEDKTVWMDAKTPSRHGYGGSAVKVAINRNIHNAIRDCVESDGYKDIYFAVPFSDSVLLGAVYPSRVSGQYSTTFNMSLAIYKSIKDVQSFVKMGSVKPICSFARYDFAYLDEGSSNKISEKEFFDRIPDFIVNEYLKKNADSISTDGPDDGSKVSEDSCPYELKRIFGSTSTGIDREANKSGDGVRFFIDDVTVDGSAYHIVRFVKVNDYFDNGSDEKVQVFKNLARLDKFIKWDVSPARWKQTSELGEDGEIHYSGHYMEKHIPTSLKKDIVTDKGLSEKVISAAKLMDFDKCMKKCYNTRYDRYWKYSEK